MVVIMRRGGGSRKVIEGLVAAIGVQYPVGWTCTCTKDSTTLTAKNTSGLVVFSLPAAGTWTVTATTGSGNSAQTKNESVTIAENEVKRVNLRSLEILTPANGLGSVGGTQITYSGSGASVSSNKLVVNVADGDTGSFRFSPAISLSSYSTMTVKGKVTGIQNMYSELILGFTASNSAVTASNKSSAFSASVTFTANDFVDHPDTILTKTVDISGLTGTLYLNSYVLATRAQITEIILT